MNVSNVWNVKLKYKSQKCSIIFNLNLIIEKKNPKKINVRHVSNVWNIKLEFLSLDSVIYLEFPFCVLKHNNLLLVRFQNGLRDHLSTTYFERIFIEQKHMLSNLITSKSLSQL